jgi:Cu(I)/Ag(I) efflux system membrane fusion protein
MIARAYKFIALLAVFSMAVMAGCESSPPSTSAAVQVPVYSPRIIRQSGGAEFLSIGASTIPGMTIVPVQAIALPAMLEANGKVAYDERNVAQIVSRVAGRIEAARALLWDNVRRGEPIVRLYSPDFMTAEAEYLQALATRKVTPSGGDAQMADALVAAARRKLELLGMPAADIDSITEPAPYVWMRAPISGTVLKNNANIGAAINPGDVLYTLGTLANVWITASIYETDLARVHLGQRLEAVTTAYPDRTFTGFVSRISPDIDPSTYTAGIRCDIRNPGGMLKPDMLVRVRIETVPGVALVIPQQALIFEMNSYYVFVARGNGLYERRQVRIASWNEDGLTRITWGLSAGERVVAGESIQLNSLWQLARGTS